MSCSQFNWHFITNNSFHFCTTGVVLFYEIEGSVVKCAWSKLLNCWIELRNSIILYSFSLRTYCILTQRHTCVAQAQDISNMLNELSSAVEEGAEFTLTRINMFGNSNSLHLTSLCEKKSGETFDNDIFHMIRAPMKKCLLRGSEAQENCLLTTQQPSYCGCQSAWHEEFLWETD